MAAYDQYFAGDLANYTLSEKDITKNIEQLEKVI
jgi:tryptophan synthase beta chain